MTQHSPAPIGHNKGPTLERGFSFRRHAWAKARAQLIPTLPIEILRSRVNRAKSLGLPYKTYASVRASTGRDVVGFLFSNNALRILRPGADLPEDRAAKLQSLEAVRTALAHAPVTLEHLGFAHSGPAPHFAAPWSQIRDMVQAPLRAADLPLDGVLVIGDTVFEREWCDAGRLAGYVPSSDFFAHP